MTATVHYTSMHGMMSTPVELTAYNTTRTSFSCSRTHSTAKRVWNHTVQRAPLRHRQWANRSSPRSVRVKHHRVCKVERSVLLHFPLCYLLPCWSVAERLHSIDDDGHGSACACMAGVCLYILQSVMSWHWFRSLAKNAWQVCDQDSHH